MQSLPARLSTLLLGSVLASAPAWPQVDIAKLVPATGNPLDMAGTCVALGRRASPGPAGLPCGLSIPGFGMAGAGAPGELLIPVTPTPVVAGPLPWRSRSRAPRP